MFFTSDIFSTHIVLYSLVLLIMLFVSHPSGVRPDVNAPKDVILVNYAGKTDAANADA